MLSLHRSLLWLFAGALLLPGLPAQAAEVDKYLPDDADVVLFLNVKQLTEAPLLVKHKVPDLLRGLLAKNDEASKVLNDLGFDPLKDLTSITVSVSGLQKPKGLAIAHGQFDVTKFKAKAEQEAKDRSDYLKVKTEGGHTFYELRDPKEDKPAYAGLVDSTTLVFSNEKELVLNALDRGAGKSQGTLNKDLRDLIEKEKPDQTLWLVAPGNALSKIELPAGTADEKSKETLKKIDSISAGLTVSNDIKFLITFAAKSATSAKELAEDMKQGLNQAKALLALAAGDKKELAPAVDALGAVKVVTEGTKVTVRADISAETIDKAIKKGQEKE